MTITAVDAQPTDVVIVAERNRLVANDVDLGDIRRPHKHPTGGCGTRQDEGSAEDGRASEGVRTGVEYLRHRSLLSKRRISWRVVCNQTSLCGI